MALASAYWRQALELLRDEEKAHAWQLRETPSTGGLAALLDYHVCYSASYQVPTLVFRATCPDGSPLGHTALQRLFPSWPAASEQLGAFVVQQDHPLLPGPCWFTLHPCNTAVALALALGLGAADVGPCGPGTEPGGAAHAEGATPAAAAADGRADAAGSSLGPPTRATQVDSEQNQDLESGVEPGQDGDVPDLDALLAGDGAVGDEAGAARVVVGPAGVRWPGGEAPLCPGEPEVLGRYMRVWFSLVAPHVGLRGDLL
ncbi:hypothetical protein HYH03_005461 [Edaphochlamys debaryana]|uniref:Ubiquitin-like-conjugating enzyme ATG10 n=1 Tax=Edaphochlamys debaryana TaxID=47281 RepID=A0A835Y9E2_9CHLO|nr:hypothetical protein HYH03_005461 [Edaphochlamys debaryana]|eukprot:KAG2496641.1 hypothetical protein HYH03_005461 [Edaphochlamys debaryana]